jgi:hypothetical protein
MNLPDSPAWSLEAKQGKIMKKSLNLFIMDWFWSLPVCFFRTKLLVCSWGFDSVTLSGCEQPVNSLWIKVLMLLIPDLA